MSVNLYTYSKHRKIFPAIILSGLLSCSSAYAETDQFDAGKVMNAMSSDERTAYLSGVIEGLAIARYNKDGKQKAGMGCIYDWYYKDKGNMKLIYETFDKYPTYPPGSIVDVLVKQKCGE